MIKIKCQGSTLLLRCSGIRDTDPLPETFRDSPGALLYDIISLCYMQTRKHFETLCVPILKDWTQCIGVVAFISVPMFHLD